MDQRPNGGAHRRHRPAQPTDLAEQKDRWRPVQSRVGPLKVRFLSLGRWLTVRFQFLKVFVMLLNRKTTFSLSRKGRDITHQEASQSE